MVKIPAGEFAFQDGRKINLPDFWIDTHEVTIGQYADFLAWAAFHPGQAREVAPAGMPAEHSYVPVGWADEKTAAGVKPGTHSIARAGGVYEGATLTLDSPVFGIDWFDASAYATWKGRRLPSEEEWEKAALGSEGKKYPWGNDWKPGDANISSKDAFEKWSGVDAVPADRSPAGVIGMAGNISEWTLTIVSGGGGRMSPIIRGGNWSDAELDIRRRLHNLDAAESAPTVGFRTVSDRPPQP
jgi:formylglycine-generating enzyme required for sulfatase activity